jgi:hypothetical protein
VKYGAAFVKTLTVIREEHGLMCGKPLVPYIRSTIDFLKAKADCYAKGPYPALQGVIKGMDPETYTLPKQHPPSLQGGVVDYGITDDIYRLLLEASPAEADILLAPARKGREIKGVSTTRAASQSLRAQAPVQTHFNRETVRPGQFAFDTVAHCGGSAQGQFCKTLTGTDVYSGWTEERPLLNGANKRVFEAFTNIKTELPFPLLGGHFDNGVGFINKPLIGQRALWNIAMTRSRPYKKNDNYFAGQKNFDMARKNAGYFMFDRREEAEALGEVYRFLCPLNNYFPPSFKLIAKEKRADGRYKKVYEEAPKTPYRRLMESPLVSEESKEELKRRKGFYNPPLLNDG